MDDHNETHNDDQLDNTLYSSQDGATFLRHRPLREDIDAGLFDSLLQPSKRSDKNKRLKDEQFDFSVYLRNQCGFITWRPLFWMEQIEKYIWSQTDVNSVVHYKWSKNIDKYESTVIDIAYQTTRKVTIVINFIKGVVMVKGENFRHWIETEAIKVNPSLTCISGDVPPADEGVNDETNDTENETAKQLQSLWHDNQANKTSIESIDCSQKELREQIDRYLSAHSAAVEDVAHLYGELTKSDNKMTTFMETTQATCQQMITTELSKINKRIDKVFDKISEIKVNVNDRIDKFIQNHNKVNENILHIQELRDDIEKQKKEIHEVIEEYKSFQADETSEEAGKRQTNTARKLSALRQDFDFQRTDLSNLVEDLRKRREEDESRNEDALRKLSELQDAIEVMRAERSDNNSQTSTPDTDLIAKRVQELLAHNTNNNTNNANNNQAQNNHRERRKLYEGRDVDVMFCMDSNSKFIKFKKLWTVKNTVRRRVYTQQQLKEYIMDLHAKSIKYFLIHIGVNDIDHAAGDEVYEQIADNISLLQQKYPEIKIILAELTPRRDTKNEEVNKCNQLLNQYCTANDNIFIASHESLRSNVEYYLYDNKHVSRKAIGVFVVNLKKALCNAHGIPYISREEYEQRKRTEGNAHATTG